MSPRITASTVLVALKEQVSTPLNQETVLLNLKSGKYYSLNRVGGLIWELLQTPQTLSQIVDALLDRFDVDRARCESDARDVIASLIDAGFAEIRS